MLRLSASTFAFTPTHPMPLAGSRGRTASYEEVHGDLEADILRLSDDEGGEVVLGSVDTLFLTERLLSDVSSAIGNMRTPLCLFATHTHNAPSLAPELPLLGDYDHEWYHSFVSSCGRTILRLAEQPGEAVTLRYGEQATDLNVNRRRRALVIDYPALVRDRRVSADWRIVNAVNKHGAVDHRVRALFFENSSGDVRAVVWSFAAHPSRYPVPLAVSAEFPGLIRAALRRRFGKGCTVVYLPGLAGSAVPRVPLRLPGTLKNTVTLLLPFYPVSRTFTARTYREWVERVFSDLVRAYEARGSEVSGKRLSLRYGEVPKIFRSRKEGAQSPFIDLQITRVSLARGLDIVGFNGEMLSEWVPLLEHASDGTVLCSGYMAGPALYVPTSTELQNGGYEVAGFQVAFGLDGKFDPDISRRVLSEVGRLFDVDESQ